MDQLPFEVRVQPAANHFGPPEAYKNDSSPRGAVFIANYKHFDGSNDRKLSERVGSEVNVRQLKELFTQMMYEVTIYEGSGTKDDTIAALERFREKDIHRNADSLVVIFSSHGIEDEFFTSDGESINYKTVYQMFSDTNCPYLIGKPKIFMFQFCREPQTATTPYSSPKSPKHRKQGITCTYVMLSTAEGRRSYRLAGEGAIFFHHTCKVFMENAKDKDLDALVRLVSENLPYYQPLETQQWNLKKRFYFNPPIIGQDVMPLNSTNVQPETCLPNEQIQTNKQAGLSGLQEDGLYKMASNPTGKVLIINNLDGCKDDERKLSDIFRQLGFTVSEPINNVSSEELNVHFEHFKEAEHHDAAIIIIYAKGFEDHIVCSDNKAISYRDVIKKFRGGHCSALEGKPKIFIINTCCDQNSSFLQGNQDQAMGSNLAPSEFEIIKGASISEAADKDVIVYAVEVEGGNCEQGSLLTDALYQVLLAKQNSETELIPLFRLVTDSLEKLSENDQAEYFVVTFNFRFEKDFYFNLHHISLDNIDSKHVPNVKQLKKMPTPIGSNSIYRNMSQPCGKAIIICFTQYESKQLPKTYGLFDGVERYRRIAEDLGYDIKMVKNCTHECIKTSLKTLDGMNDIDSLMIMAFGYAQDVNNLYDVKGNILPVSDLFHIFADSQCPALKGKPKLFFFHMTVFHNLQECCPLPPNVDLRDAFAYFLVSSHSKNYEQHSEAGLETICTALERGSSTTDVENIMREAEEQLAKNPNKQHNERFFIMPIKFRRELFFNQKFKGNNKLSMVVPEQSHGY
ncbi:uncharacterized protein [Palaemon carinicauda]|uniref:uncharacterized protein n=1 Tax=Palaemon carinicauda TaxID=392227 RepID=UPI0035B629F7